MITLVRPFLLELAQATGETINLCLPEGDLAHYVDQIDSQYNLQIRNWTGYRLPMHATCDGKVFLAHWSEEKVEQYLARPLQGFTPQTVTGPNQLRQQLTDIRKGGYAWTHGEYEAGIDGIAVPIWDDNHQLIASVCVGGPTFRFPQKGNADIVISHLKEVSRKSSERLNIIQQLPAVSGIRQNIIVER